MIPRRLIQSVPEKTTAFQDGMWELARSLHPDWGHVSYRDPIDPGAFPRTSPYWHLCQSGAQLAGLVRLEALWNDGGIWIDSDMQIFRSLDSLRQCRAFAAWEDTNVIPDAVIGAEPRHPAIDTCINLAIRRIASRRNDAWWTGPGVTTAVFPNRDDVLLLGPESFFPVFYNPRADLEHRLASHVPAPWEFGMHHWSWSWRP